MYWNSRMKMKKHTQRHTSFRLFIKHLMFNSFLSHNWSNT